MTPTANTSLTLPTANVNVATTSAGTVVVSPTVTHSLSTFQKLMAILAAAEPLVLAGVSPFIKNTETQTIVANETPEAQALLQLLSGL